MLFNMNQDSKLEAENQNANNQNIDGLTSYNENINENSNESSLKFF